MLAERRIYEIRGFEIGTCGKQSVSNGSFIMFVILFLNLISFYQAMNITSRYLEINDDDDYHSSTDDQMVINPNRLFNSQFDFSNSQQHSNDVMQG